MALSEAQVKKMAKDRVAFKMHLTAYVLINGMLAGIWYLSSQGEGGLSGFWPVWTLLFWGIGLAFHAASVYLGTPEREEERLRRKYGQETEEGEERAEGREQA